MVRFVLILSFTALPLTLLAQGALGTGEETAASARKALLELRHELDSLKVASDSTDEARLEDLEERLEQRLAAIENKIDAVARASAPVILNPRTTAFLNFAARGDNRSVLDATGQSEISNRPFLRTVELELRNPVDPYAEAIAIISLEDEAGRGYAIDVEEAYGLIKRLPLLESAPLGLKLKIGKFRAPMGVNNKIHMHDLPWTTRPLVVAAYLGTEHGEFFESGFNPVGVDFDFFLPNPIPQTTLEMNLDLVRSGGLGLSLGQTGTQPSYIAHLTLSRDWSNEHLLLLGVSAYHENGPTSNRLYGADVTYKWAPSENRETHSFVAGAEFFSGRSSTVLPPDTEITSSPYGWYAYLQYQTSYWVYLGARYDWLKDPADDRLVTRAIAGYLSYYTTEFLRFRLGIEHRMSDVPSQDRLTTGIFEVNFVFGSHPTEPYWVNR